jgi:hypothetical protein
MLPQKCTPFSCCYRRNSLNPVNQQHSNPTMLLNASYRLVPARTCFFEHVAEVRYIAQNL